MSDQPPFDWDEGDASRRRVGGRHFATSDDPDVPVDDDDDDVAAPYDDSGYDDFDDDYGDDYLESYDDDDEYVEVRHASSRGRRALGVVLGILVVLVVAAAAAGLWVQRQIAPSGGPGEVREIEIPEGSTSDDIGVLLADEGIITSDFVWGWYRSEEHTSELQSLMRISYAV